VKISWFNFLALQMGTAEAQSRQGPLRIRSGYFWGHHVKSLSIILQGQGLIRRDNLESKKNSVKSYTSY
jgi:hypothetical protein